jgi:hypothetical protein
MGISEVLIDWLAWVILAVALGLTAYQLLHILQAKVNRLQALAPLPRLPISSGELVVAVIAACGLFATYTAIRASNRMAALQYVSDNANFIAEMEKTTPELLCLYSNSAPLGGAARTGCDRSIFSSGDKLSANFSTIQLYIEESLLFFVESIRMEQQYQFSFYGGLDYWRQDFSDDPTGAISYYVLARELDQAGSLKKIDPQSVVCLEHLTGVRFDNICLKFKGFIHNLGSAAPQAIIREPCGQLDNLDPFRARVTDKVCQPTWWYQSFRGGVPRK